MTSFFRKRVIALPLALLVSGAALSPATAQTIEIDLITLGGEKPAVRAVQLKAPEYPAKRLEEKFTAHITLTGTVGADGKLTGAVFDQSEGDEAFYAAIRKVIPDWRFQPAVDDKSCKAIPGKETVMVWFDIKDGKPLLSVAEANPAPEPKAAAKPRNFVEMPKIGFPARTGTESVEGESGVLMKVDRAGVIVDSSVLYSAPSPLFGQGVLSALAGTKLDADGSPGDPAQTSCLLLPVLFCAAESEPNGWTKCVERRKK